MKILIDMNLSPDWVPVLKDAGIEAIHWSDVGDPAATDKDIMDYAKTREFVVFTHDLDFGTILAATHAEGPSVFQVRTQDVDPASLSKAVVSVLRRYQKHLESGALFSFDEFAQRVRILPIHP
jgi:predicted nuclease of predicted toxin-antitoxin system